MILASDRSMDGIASELMRLVGKDDAGESPAKAVVGGAGEAMRLIHRHQPRVLMICVGRQHLDDSAELIGTLHHRRPGLPVMAVAAEHDETVERAVRGAGASYYFALDGEDDPMLIRRTLESLGFQALAPPKHSGRSPPEPPPPRSRGAPRAGRR